MTNYREVFEPYRYDLSHPIRDRFIWVLGENTVTEMTRICRENDPNKMDMNQSVAFAVTLHIGIKPFLGRLRW